MNDLNEILLEGKLVKDPEISWIKGTDQAVCKFTIATNKNYKDKKNNQWVQDTSFFTIETWRNVAQMCSKNLKKGRGVRVVGTLKQDRWTDTKNGNRFMERVFVVADHVELQPMKKQAENNLSVSYEEMSKSNSIHNLADFEEETDFSSEIQDYDASSVSENLENSDNSENTDNEKAV